MADIAFHSGVPDKLAYACRLLRKAYRSNARVVVSGPSDLIARLDQMLWVFDDLEFIPHVRARGASAVQQARTPIVLVEEGSSAEVPHQEVLLHLGANAAPGCERFARVIEVISTEPADRDAGRRRWREYEARGHALTHHVMGAA